MLRTDADLWRWKGRSADDFCEMNMGGASRAPFVAHAKRKVPALTIGHPIRGLVSGRRLTDRSSRELSVLSQESGLVHF